MLPETKTKNYTVTTQIRKCILTERKAEYLSLVAMGIKNNKIAKILNVEECTVKKTLEDIFHNLNAKDRTNMVSIAWEHGILNSSVLKKISERYSLND